MGNAMRNPLTSLPRPARDLLKTSGLYSVTRLKAWINLPLSTSNRIQKRRQLTLLTLTKWGRSSGVDDPWSRLYYTIYHCIDNISIAKHKSFSTYFLFRCRIVEACSPKVQCLPNTMFNFKTRRLGLIRHFYRVTPQIITSVNSLDDQICQISCQCEHFLHESQTFRR